MKLIANLDGSFIKLIERNANVIESVRKRMKAAGGLDFQVQQGAERA
ncbi:MAG: hypothetical protein QOE82_1172, partial [Thermoanaerobaculia bacterium]|nr:hypothetical protein [Thermoanaerobaculia bacterium]